MTKRSKSYRAAAEKVHADVLYTPFEAMKLAKETTVTKFDSTVEQEAHHAANEHERRPEEAQHSRAPYEDEVDGGKSTDRDD